MSIALAAYEHEDIAHVMHVYILRGFSRGPSKVSQYTPITHKCATLCMTHHQGTVSNGTTGLNDVAVISPHEWNIVPQCLRRAETLSTFQKHFKNIQISLQNMSFHFVWDSSEANYLFIDFYVKLYPKFKSLNCTVCT